MKPGDSLLLCIHTVEICKTECFTRQDGILPLLEQVTLSHPGTPQGGQIFCVHHTATRAFQRQLVSGPLMQEYHYKIQTTWQLPYCDSLFSLTLWLNQSQHDAFSAASLILSLYVINTWCCSYYFSDNTISLTRLLTLITLSRHLIPSTPPPTSDLPHFG